MFKLNMLQILASSHIGVLKLVFLVTTTNIVTKLYGWLGNKWLTFIRDITPLILGKNLAVYLRIKYVILHTETMI